MHMVMMSTTVSFDGANMFSMMQGAISSSLEKKSPARRILRVAKKRNTALLAQVNTSRLFDPMMLKSAAVTANELSISSVPP